MSALPATMNCVEIKTPGGPEALVPTTRPRRTLSWSAPITSAK